MALPTHKMSEIMTETNLTERQQKILNLIKESPTITVKQMSETLSLSQHPIERIYQHIKDKYRQST